MFNTFWFYFYSYKTKLVRISIENKLSNNNSFKMFYNHNFNIFFLMKILNILETLSYTTVDLDQENIHNI